MGVDDETAWKITYRWGTWEPDRLRGRLRRYREKHPGGQDYVAMLDAIIPTGDE